jgi:myo-inositol-1(or 4)-monophosphatase
MTLRPGVVDAVRAAGRIAREGFTAGPVDAQAKGDAGDLLTRLDLAAEALLIDELSRLYPEFGITSEERGDVGPDSEYRWLVDPLDGTNNVALGLPLYGVCLTLLRAGRPCAAVVHDSQLDRTAVAVEGEGATLDGVPLRIARGGDLHTATVSWFQGHGVPRDDPEATRLFAVLTRRTKRVLRTWSPAIDWLLAAQGRVGAVIAYRNELEDLLCGRVLVAEAGGSVLDVNDDLVIAGALAEQIAAVLA